MTEGNGRPAVTVLDYASPRFRGRVRLPSRSHLDLTADATRVILTETLSGRASAVVAILFALLVLVLLTINGAQALRLSLRYDAGGGLVLVLLLVFVPWLALVVLMPLVIGNTWRKTILEAKPGGLSLAFASPYGTRRYHWRPEEITDILVAPTPPAEGYPPLAELQIRVAPTLVCLFTDHPEAGLREAAALLRQHMGLRPAAAAVVVPPA